MKPFLAESLVDPAKIRANSQLYFSIYDVSKRLDLLSRQAPLTEMRPREMHPKEAPVLHFYPSLEVYATETVFVYPRNDIPAELHNLIKIYSNNNVLEYAPIFYFSSVMRGLNSSTPVADSDSAMPLYFKINPVSIGKMRLCVTLDSTFAMLKSYGFTETDFAEIKSLFLDTNYYLLMTVTLVSILHLFVDYLSLKSDISFWRQDEYLAGNSKRTVIWSCFSETIILLYLYEEKGSLLVTLPMLFKVTVEYWKWFRITRTRVTTKHIQTEQWDYESTRYLYPLLVPLILSTFLYSYLYLPYK
ncbi:Cleft lip and palate associated transmembrane protein 1, partial [Cichlidogyrus casuarinus]